MRKIKAFRTWKHWPAILGAGAVVLGMIAVISFFSGLLQGPTDPQPPNAAEWLSAISTFWSAIATAVGAVLTAGALLVAAMSYRKQVADRHQELINQHKAQAVSVTVGSRTEIIPAVKARTSISNYFSDKEKHTYFVRNGSQLPIYRVDLVVGETDAVGSFPDVLPPGEETSCEASSASLPAFVHFTDSSGVAWKRTRSGELSELHDGYLSSTW